MLLIPYSLLGMPVNGILFAGVGEYFSTTFTGIYTRYKKYRINNDTRYVPRQFGLIATIAIALLPGIAFFIILPSCLFTYFEDWPFSLSVYYSYVTTTTIGFGDYVPTFAPTQPREFGGWFVFYQIFIIFWFIFSLGYLLMIITFITKALKSKKLRKMEQQLRTNIRQTQNKIWHGVSKDVGYLRRILNELYIMKFKPVYNEEGESDLHLPRSISCPDLTIYRTDSPIVSRKRAFSECYDMDDSRAFRVDGTPMIKGSSDTDLSRINKQKTFETAEAFKHTTDLLAKVVTALASIETPQEPTVGMTGYYGDVQGFSDSQILASENSFNPADIPHRSRAMSDFYINPNTRSPSGPNEWTWSGDNSRIQQAINDRFKTAKPTRTVSMGDDPYTINMPFDETAGKKKKFSIADGKNFIKNWLPFKRRDSQDAFAQKDRKMSILSAPPETPIDNSQA
uniref:Potassium channel domain-containing protein n=1 Tax=Megaselia scalaris TaxID=36166 RepID=T1GP23_MEGSC